MQYFYCYIFIENFPQKFSPCVFSRRKNLCDIKDVLLQALQHLFGTFFAPITSFHDNRSRKPGE